MNSIRRDDTIISAQGRAYSVIEIRYDGIDAAEIDPPHRERIFDEADLFCVDADDGLWQETETR